jgi:hypothetical protein
MTVPCKASFESTIDKDVQTVWKTYSNFSGKVVMDGHQIPAENLIINLSAPKNAVGAQRKMTHMDPPIMEDLTIYDPDNMVYG